METSEIKEESFLEALNSKYAQDYASTLKNEEDELFFVDAKTKHTKKVEMVGMEKIGAKQSRLDRLQQVSLRESNISHIESDIGTVCPNITDIDITHNLIKDWSTASILGKHLPNLQILSLSSNPIANHRLTEPLPSPPAFPALKILALNRCYLTWDQIEFIESWFPNLEELHICFNDLSQFHLKEGDYVHGFNNLITLNLDGNNIRDWNEVLKFSHLPKLERILINNNQIKDITLPNPAEQFVHLKSLSITHNQISDWQTINVLDQFAHLNTLRFSFNPLTAQLGPFVARQTLIARIGKMDVLNGSEVRSQERQEAEKFYVKDSFKSFRKSTLNNDSIKLTENPAFLQLHPRYPTLEAKYGAPVVEAQEAQTLAEELIAVTLTSMTGQMATVPKKLPASLLVSNLKIMCHRLFQVDPSDQRLYLKPTKASPFAEPLDDDTRPLSYYGVVNGSEIIVEAK